MTCSVSTVTQVYDDLFIFDAWCLFCLSSVQSFNLAKHLNTAPELVDRVYNRPTLETLEKKSIQGAVDPRSLMVRVSMHLDQLHLLCEELEDCSERPEVTFHGGKVDSLPFSLL